MERESNANAGCEEEEEEEDGGAQPSACWPPSLTCPLSFLSHAGRTS